MWITMVLLVFHWSGGTNGSLAAKCPKILTGLFKVTGPACNLTLDGCFGPPSLTTVSHCPSLGNVSDDTQIKCVTSLTFENDNITIIALYNETSTDEYYFYLRRDQNENYLVPVESQSQANHFAYQIDDCSSSTPTTSITTLTTPTTLHSLIAIPVLVIATAVAIIVAWHTYKQRKLTKEQNERRRDLLTKEIFNRRYQSSQEPSTNQEKCENGETYISIEDTTSLNVETNQQNGRESENVYEVVEKLPEDGKEESETLQ